VTGGVAPSASSPAPASRPSSGRAAASGRATAHAGAKPPPTRGASPPIEHQAVPRPNIVADAAPIGPPPPARVSSDPEPNGAPGRTVTPDSAAPTGQGTYEIARSAGDGSVAESSEISGGSRDGSVTDRSPVGGGSGTRGSGGGGGGGAGDRFAALTPGGAGGAGSDYAAYLARLRQRIQESLRYPPAARRRGVTGTVQLEIDIAPDGAIGAVTVIASSSHEILDRAAVDAARTVPRAPFPADLRPRALKVRLPIVFELQ
jgi:protein TonB